MCRKCLINNNLQTVFLKIRKANTIAKYKFIIRKYICLCVKKNHQTMYYDSLKSKLSIIL